MAAETNTLLGQGRQFEPRGGGNLRPNAKNAISALREGARA